MTRCRTLKINVPNKTAYHTLHNTKNHTSLSQLIKNLFNISFCTLKKITLYIKPIHGVFTCWPHWGSYVSHVPWWSNFDLVRRTTLLSFSSLWYQIYKLWKLFNVINEVFYQNMPNSWCNADLNNDIKYCFFLFLK